MSYNSGSNRAPILKLLARLLPELYSTRSNYYYISIHINGYNKCINGYDKYINGYIKYSLPVNIFVIGVNTFVIAVNMPLI